MIVSLLLNCEYFGSIQTKIFQELQKRNRQNRDDHDNMNDALVDSTQEVLEEPLSRSEQIIRNLFKNWNLLDNNNDTRKLREKDIVNSFLSLEEGIENVDEWLVEIQGVPG